MKINFRKISAIAASALMTGMTMGVAAAANYPAPFVSGGTANAAIVYGTGTGVNSLDFVQATSIQESLEEYVTGGSVTVEGGESFKLEKTSNKFNLGDALNATYADLDDEQMEFLADGEYDDGDIDEEYTQSITLGSKTLSIFTDSDYNNKEPTIGFKWSNGENILDYDLEFDSAIVLADMNDTEFPLMGKEFYVLSATNSVIELLDSAEKVTVYEADPQTVDGNEISIYSIDANGVRFTVNGVNTNKLGEHDYEELDDGSYLVLNSFVYDTRDGKDSFAEVSLGAGLVTMESGEEIQVNDEDVDGLVATFDSDSINIAWGSDGETFLTEENAVVMPLFETISLVFNGLVFPDEPETIALENGETMTLMMGNYELPLFHFAGTAGASSTLGEEDYPLVTTLANVSNYTAGGGNTSAFKTGGLDLIEDSRFIITVNDTDLGDVETMYYEVKTIDWDDSDVLVELDDLIGTKDLSFDDLTDTQSVGDVTVALNQVNDTHVYLTFSGATLNYNVVVSEKGMRVTLPATTLTGTVDLSSGQAVTFQEADKDEDLGEGTVFTATVKATTNDKLHASTTSVNTYEGDDDVYWGHVVSDLATKVTHDQTADEYDFELEYYGEEVTADVKVVGGSSSISGGSSTLGNILVKDSEVSSVGTKNLIVVGGSCINSAAAALVGGALCGEAWTQETGVGSGQFLIKGYADSTLTNKLALLVAGYDAEDTVKATTYLLNKDVDTSKALKGTSSTLVAVEIEEA